MDRMTIICKLKDLFGKYKFVMLILALGMLFMATPQKPQEEPQLFSRYVSLCCHQMRL